MASAVTVCNGGLVRIGAARIAALNENSVEARLCNERYEPVLKDLLRSHPWKFATKWATVATVTNPPTLKYSNVFAIPADCIRVIGTASEVDNWDIEGQYISSDNAELEIQYISFVEDPNNWDEGFRELMSLAIANDLCYTLAQSSALKQLIMQEYKAKLREVRSFNGQESSPPRVYADLWLNTRRS